MAPRFSLFDSKAELAVLIVSWFVRRRHAHLTKHGFGAPGVIDLRWHQQQQQQQQQQRAAATAVVVAGEAVHRSIHQQLAGAYRKAMALQAIHTRHRP